MSTTQPASELARVEEAYRVLGVPTDSSALRIKREYRRLARTWHPDKFADNAPEQRRATERMREINDAFQLAKHAPLRFRVNVRPGSENVTVASRARRTAPVTDTAEYIVRFVAGVAFGLFVSLLLTLGDVPLSVLVAIPLVTGGASAVFGDRFWYLVLRLWWLWTP
jgi:hypothetical protein